MIKGSSTKKEPKKGAGCVGTEHEAQDGELFLTLAVSCRASMVRGEEAGRFCEVACVSIIAAACLRSAVDTSTVDSRVTTSSFNITT